MTQEFTARLDELLMAKNVRGDYARKIEGIIGAKETNEDILDALIRDIDPLLQGLEQIGRDESRRAAIQYYAEIADVFYRSEMNIDKKQKDAKLSEIANFASTFNINRTKFLRAVGEILAEDPAYHKRLPQLMAHGQKYLEIFYSVVKDDCQGMGNFGYVTFPLFVQNSKQSIDYGKSLTRLFRVLATKFDNVDEVVYGMMEQVFKSSQEWDDRVFSSDEISNNRFRDALSDSVIGVLSTSKRAIELYKDSIISDQDVNVTTNLVKEVFNRFRKYYFNKKSTLSPLDVLSVMTPLNHPFDNTYNGTPIRTMGDFIRYVKKVEIK